MIQRATSFIHSRAREKAIQLEREREEFKK